MTSIADDIFFTSSSKRDITLLAVANSFERAVTEVTAVVTVAIACSELLSTSNAELTASAALLDIS